MAILLDSYLPENELYKMEVQNKHVVIIDDIGQKILVATGSYYSYINPGQPIVLKGFEHWGKEMPELIKSFCDNLNLQIDGILGMDYLMGAYPAFILSKKIFTSHHECFRHGLEVQEIGTCPGSFNPEDERLQTRVIEFEFLDSIYQFIFDSSAPNTLVLPKFREALEASELITGWHQPSGVITGWHPVAGKFSSETYKVKMIKDDLKFVVDVGITPAPITKLIRENRIDPNCAGIIGYDLIKNMDFDIWLVGI